MDDKVELFGFTGVEEFIMDDDDVEVVVVVVVVDANFWWDSFLQYPLLSAGWWQCFPVAEIALHSIILFTMDDGVFTAGDPDVLATVVGVEEEDGFNIDFNGVLWLDVVTGRPIFELEDDAVVFIFVLDTAGEEEDDDEEEDDNDNDEKFWIKCSIFAEDNNDEDNCANSWCAGILQYPFALALLGHRVRSLFRHNAWHWSFIL